MFMNEELCLQFEKKNILKGTGENVFQIFENARLNFPIHVLLNAWTKILAFVSL